MVEKRDFADVGMVKDKSEQAVISSLESSKDMSMNEVVGERTRQKGRG